MQSLKEIVAVLEAAGCVAADEEAAELASCARSDAELAAMTARRAEGEPLAWITGRARFCGLAVGVTEGVYVPRWQSESLARMAAECLPAGGIGVDLCTGSGAIGLVMAAARPAATVVGTELDPSAAACARRNGLRVYLGDLADPLPGFMAGRVDVMVGVLPYVPPEAFHLLPRDVVCFEPRLALDGGRGGTELLSAAVTQGIRWLRSGGRLLLECGEDQVEKLRACFLDAGYDELEPVTDGDGDRRGCSGRRPS